MAIDITVTPELRAQMEAADDATRAVFGLAKDTIEEWEDGFRTNGQPNTFEWWYFDAQLSDGSAVVVTFSTKPHTHPEGPISPVLLVMHRSADGVHTKKTLTFSADDFHAEVGTCDVRLGPNWVRGNLDEYHLHVEAEDVLVDLHIDRKAPSYRPGAGVNYYDKAQTKYLAWVVPVPYGDTTGTVTVNGTTSVVSGGVYHDHNWGNAVMGDYLDHWYWGRAHIEDYTVIYAMLTTKNMIVVPEIHLPVLYVAKNDKILVTSGLGMRLVTSDVVEGPGGQHYPQRLEFTKTDESGTVAFTLTNPTLIEALDMSDQDGPDWARALKHLVANPMYYDFTADMELTVNTEGVNETVTGTTIFERMMFR